MISRRLRRWTRSRAARIVSGSVAAALVSTLVLDRTVAALGVSMDTAAGVVLALGVTFGPWVAVGAGIGSVLGDVVTGTFGVRSTIGYAAAFVFVYTGIVFWNTIDRSQSDDGVVRLTATFLLAGTTAAVAMAVLGAWGAEIFGLMPFAVAFVGRLTDAIIGVAVVGSPVFLSLRVLIERTNLGKWAHTVDGPAFRNRRSGFGVVAVLVTWGLASVGLSLLFQPLQLEHPQIIANRLGWTAQTLVALAGPGGRHLLILLGLVGVGCLLYLRPTLE